MTSQVFQNFAFMTDLFSQNSQEAYSMFSQDFFSTFQQNTNFQRQDSFFSNFRRPYQENQFRNFVKNTQNQLSSNIKALSTPFDKKEVEERRSDSSRLFSSKSYTQSFFSARPQ